MKKKLLLISCIAALSLSLVACGDKDSSSNKENATSAVSSSESSSESVENEIKDSTESTDDSSKSDSSKTEDASAKEIMQKMVDNIGENKNCEMTANMSMTAKIEMEIDGVDPVSQNMVSNMQAEAKSTNKGMYSKTKTTTNEGDGDSVETEETYTVYDTKRTYTSKDGGSSWAVDLYNENDSKITDMSAIFKNEDAFKTATVETKDGNYVIDLDIKEVKEFTDSISGDFGNADITGFIEIVVDKDYYPVSIEMKDLKFDTEAMEEMIKSMSTMEDSSESSTSSPATEPKVNIDLDFTFKVNYSGWNTVDDKDVTPSQTIIDSATGSVSSDTSSNSSTITTSDKPAD